MVINSDRKWDVRFQWLGRCNRHFISIAREFSGTVIDQNGVNCQSMKIEIKGTQAFSWSCVDCGGSVQGVVKRLDVQRDRVVLNIIATVPKFRIIGISYPWRAVHRLRFRLAAPSGKQNYANQIPQKFVLVHISLL